MLADDEYYELYRMINKYLCVGQRELTEAEITEILEEDMRRSHRIDKSLIDTEEESRGAELIRIGHEQGSIEGKLEGKLEGEIIGTRIIVAQLAKNFSNIQIANMLGITEAEVAKILDSSNFKDT